MQRPISRWAKSLAALISAAPLNFTPCTSHEPLRLTFYPYVLILFSMGQGSEIEPEGQIYTLNLLERLHAGLRDFGQTKDELYWRIDALLRELRNPNLHEVELTTAYQIELWDRHGKSHLRMVSEQPTARTRFARR